jgi:hypothetical protein
MIFRLAAFAAVIIIISACAARIPETDGYVYPVYPGWPTPASLAGLSGLPTKQDLTTTTRAVGDLGISESRTSASTGIWLFLPNPLGGGN